MPTIPYPNVPNYQGVPPVPRQSPGVPTIQLSSGPNVNYAASPALPPWGIYQHGQSASPATALFSTNQGGTLSFFSFNAEASSQVSDFPTESPNQISGAQFAAYNKVWVPISLNVSLAFSGSDGEKTEFLAALELAKEGVGLWDIHTPDAPYVGYVMESYSYQRSASHGASMLTARITFKQILEVAESYVSLPQPQSPSAQPPSNSGTIQAQEPSSILYGMVGSHHAVGVGGNSAQGNSQ